MAPQHSLPNKEQKPASPMSLRFFAFFAPTVIAQSAPTLPLCLLALAAVDAIPTDVLDGRLDKLEKQVEVRAPSRLHLPHQTHSSRSDTCVSLVVAAGDRS